MIEKHFYSENPASVVFDPVPSYAGHWVFELNNLRKNAKVENGINLWEEFYKRTYQDQLVSIFKTSKVLDIQVRMISKPNSNNIGRCLQYSKVDFFIDIIALLIQNIDNYGLSDSEREERKNYLIGLIGQDNEKLNIGFSEALSEKAKKLKEVLEKEVNSDYFEAAMRDYAPYKESLSFSDYIKRSYKLTTELQVGMLRLGDFFDRSVPFDELYQAFDPDKFFLLFAKIIYEFNLMREEKEGLLDNSYGFLMLYKKALDEMVSEDKKYDPKVLFTFPRGKKLRYSRWQFRDELNDLMSRHPEAKSFKLPVIDNDSSKYRDIELIEKLTRLYDEDIRVNWEFLPEGVGIKKSEGSASSGSSSEIDKDALREEVNLRIMILEKSGYIGRPIKGLDTFNGYYAFIYPNGKVILEKFWENEETLNPARKAATYVMTIDNFIEMSKIPRIDLVEYIKTVPEIGVKRIFHTTINNWQRNLYNEINGTYRLEDAIDFISSLKSGDVRNDS